MGVIVLDGNTVITPVHIERFAVRAISPLLGHLVVLPDPVGVDRHPETGARVAIAAIGDQVILHDGRRTIQTHNVVAARVIHGVVGDDDVRVVRGMVVSAGRADVDTSGVGVIEGVALDEQIVPPVGGVGVTLVNPDARRVRRLPICICPIAGDIVDIVVQNVDAIQDATRVVLELDAAAHRRGARGVGDLQVLDRPVRLVVEVQRCGRAIASDNRSGAGAIVGDHDRIAGTA